MAGSAGRACPRNTPSRRSLLDEVERTIRSIKYPVLEPGFFHAQCHHVLMVTGMNVSREVLMTDHRRIDLVVVDRRGIVAIELEQDDTTERTTGKFRDLPGEVMRMLVLRNRVVPLVKAPYCDRVVNMRSDMRPVEWTVDGRAILEETPRATLPSVELALSRAHEFSLARRTIMMGSVGERKGPRSAGVLVAKVAKKAVPK